MPKISIPAVAGVALTLLILSGCGSSGSSSSTTAATKTGAGSLFGLASSPSANSIYYVDDDENTVNVLH